MNRWLVLVVTLFSWLAGCNVIVGEQPNGSDLGVRVDLVLDGSPVFVPDCCDQPDLRGEPDLAINPMLAGWPMPGHDAQNTSRSAVVGPAQGRKAWTAAVTSVGPPVVAPDGTVYVSSHTNGGITGLSPVDGTVRAATNGGCANLALGPDGTIYNDPCTNVPRLCGMVPGVQQARWCAITPSDPRVPLVIDADGTVFATFFMDLIAFAQADGQVLWSLPLSSPGVGVAESPDRHLLYSATRDLVTVRDRQTGNKKFDIPFTNVRFPPSVGVDGTLYVYEMADSNPIVAYDVNQGHERWRYSVSPGEITSAPAVAADGTLRVMVSSGGSGVLHALTPDGKLAWSYPAPAGTPGAPVVDSRGVTYFVAGGGHVFAVEPTGKLRFDFAASARPEVRPTLGPTNLLYVLGTDDKMIAVGP